MSSKEQSSEKIRRDIFSLIDSYCTLSMDRVDFDNFPLVVPTFGSEEIKEAVDSLLSTYLTMGKKCAQFELDFAEYIGVKHALFVNSGSTANLIALSILSSPVISDPIKPGDEIITPALTWSTTVFPIYDIGATPVFLDCSPDTFTMNLEQIESVITDKTKAIMPVHLLGNPCDMEEIIRIADKNGLYVIEDCCEALGSKFTNKMVGSFGHLSTFSFFFSHHISTIEGGMVLTNEPEYNEIGKSLRAHGWIRERSDRDSINEKYPDFDSRFLFIHRGYNVRPTEIQGAFGIHQLPKLEKFVEARIRAAEYLVDRLAKYKEYIILPELFDNDVRQAWFGFALIVRPDAPFTREELSLFLEEYGIETRPIMGGNFVEQPVMNSFPYRTVNSLPGARLIFRNGVFFGLHHELDSKSLEKIINIFHLFFDQL